MQHVPILLLEISLAKKFKNYLEKYMIKKLEIQLNIGHFYKEMNDIYKIENTHNIQYYKFQL